MPGIKVVREVCRKAGCRWLRTVGDQTLCGLNKMWMVFKGLRKSEFPRWQDSGEVIDQCPYLTEHAVMQ